MTEINDWIPVKGYEGLYEVSGILGKVRSLNYNKTGRVKIMNGGHTKNGYVQHTLSKNGKKDTFLEHRIVAEHFCPNPFNKPCVNHKNEFAKDDNRACCLEWVTYEENNNYGTRNERMAKTKINGKKSKPVQQFTLNGEFIREWPSVHEVGRNGFKFTHVSACCLGKRKSHHGYIWRFKSAI